MALKSFDPNKCIVTINLVPITGWSDGDMINVSFNTDKTNTHVGTGGEGRFIDMKDRSGVCTMRLSDYSPANAVLQLISDINVEVAISIVDKTSAGDTFFTSGAKIGKDPDLVKGAETKTNEWPWKFHKGKITHGGAAEI